MTIVADKMFRILDTIADEKSDVVSLARLTKLTDVPKATLYRLLCDLSDAGVLDHGPGGYSLGTRLFELGHSVPSYRRLRRSSVHHLEALNQSTSETVHLAALQGTRLVILEKLVGRSKVRIPTSVGMKLPMHSTALGKVALAHSSCEIQERMLASELRPFTPHTLQAPGLLKRQLERCGDSGIALEIEETIRGVGCIAAPVMTSDGLLLGAVSVAGDPGTRHNQQLTDRVRNTAQAISRQMEEQLVA